MGTSLVYGDRFRLRRSPETRDVPINTASVLVREAPLTRRDERSHEVVIRISCAVTGRAIADLEIHDVLATPIDEMVRVACARLEARTHARRELGLAGIGDERRPSFEDIDQLVLLRVRMSQSRDRVRRQAREIDTEIRQAERITERTLLPPRDA